MVEVSKDTTPVKMCRIWTHFYNPFQLGGTLTMPTGTDVIVDADVELGKGFTGYQITSPGGKTLIVEATSGGIVGSNLEKVQEDIAGAELEVMQKQVEQARVQALGMRVIPEEEFWAYYDK